MKPKAKRTRTELTSGTIANLETFALQRKIKKQKAMHRMEKIANHVSSKRVIFFIQMLSLNFS